MRPRARNTDPDTSHASAKKLNPKRYSLAILRDLLVNGPGSNRKVARRTGIRYDSVHKRMSDLATDGFVRDSGKRIYNRRTNRSVIVWEAAQ